MRFKTHKCGNFREVTRFAFLPITIINEDRSSETRWLEFVKLKQKLHFDDITKRDRIANWINVEFINK